MTYYGLIKVGDTVYPRLGPAQNMPCKVLKIEFDRGARNGWFTCEMPDGEDGLFAGEELSRYRPHTYKD